MAGGRGVFDRVVDEIGDGLADKLTVCPDEGTGGRFDLKGKPDLFGDGFVKFGNIADEFAAVDRLGGLVDGAGFKAGDEQQGVERFDEIVGVFNGSFQGVAVGGRAVWFAQGCLDAIAEAIERSFEIVGDGP